jgi:ribosomal protein S18 acetylase RimI-like enzyme
MCKLRNIVLRPALEQDRAFIESVYFETQLWIIEKLFGRRGENTERAKFAEFFDRAHTQIIVVDGMDAGWLTVFRDPGGIKLDSIYLSSERQRGGVGTELIKELVKEAASLRATVSLSVAKINPARKLYERLGFVVIGEDTHKVYMESAAFEAVD